MPLSRIEIRRRATVFAKKWAYTTDEDAALVRGNSSAQAKHEDEVNRPQRFTSPGSAPGAGFAKRVEYFFELI